MFSERIWVDWLLPIIENAAQFRNFKYDTKHNLLVNYLDGRAQVGGKKWILSNHQSVNVVARQGSILVPLFFFIETICTMMLFVTMYGVFMVDFNDLVSCTSLGHGINIRMLGFVIQVSIYIHFKICMICRNDCEKCSTRSSGRN
jgi:hypothetical protein